MTDIEIFKSIILNHDEDESECTNYEKCKHCYEVNKTTCCTEFPCEINSSDLVEVTEENILKLLDTGLVVIDRWEDNICGEDKFKLPNTYYLRMKGKRDNEYFDFGWNFYDNKCMLLHDKTGCTLPFNNRPYYGRRFNCENFPEELHSGKFDACKSWVPYQDLLSKIYFDIINETVE